MFRSEQCKKKLLLFVSQMHKLEQYLELCSGAFDFRELFLEDDESLKFIQVSQMNIHTRFARRIFW